MAKKSVNEQVKEWIAKGKIVVQEAPQGVLKGRVQAVLRQLSLTNPDIHDAVFALLDDSPNWYSTAPDGSKFSDGACTAHIGAHVAILQRGGDAKLDREGRDVWLKPLVEIGALEPCYLPARNDKKLLEMGNAFYSGHLKAKSPNNAYRLADSFVEILKADEESWRGSLSEWIVEDKTRERLEFHAKLSQELKKMADNSHSELIQASCKHYVPKFLPGYEVVYIDDGDGDRITVEQRKYLESVGLSITLEDAMPDVLLINGAGALWVIEAVTSDGEVDSHKVSQMIKFINRNGKPSVGFTTTYPTWKKAAERQKAFSNLAIGSYFWIMEDGAKQFYIEG